MSDFKSLPTMAEVHQSQRAQQKSEQRTRKQAKAKRDRLEAKVEKAVRAKCVERDGYCRMAFHDAGGPCDGISEWAHLGEWKRCFTRGLPPEERHHTKGSFMACRKHHRQYDASDMVIEYGPEGANGMLTVFGDSPHE